MAVARMKDVLVERAYQVVRLISQNRLRVKLDLLFLTVSGLLILNAMGVLLNSTPFGDDALFRISNMKSLADNFLNFQWDPHSFNGYSPTLGFPWTVYAPSALLMALGFAPILLFHSTFLAYFLLLGFSVYYFARKVLAQRIVTLALPLLIWTTNTYWNITIWGAAYDRAFSLPFMFAALGLTYEYAGLLNEGQSSARKYFLVVALWFLTFLGNVYIAAIGVGVAGWLLLFSAGRKNLRTGFSRLAIIFGPVLAFSAWFWVPLVEHVVVVGAARDYLIPEDFSHLFLAAPPFSSSLNLLYIPSIAALSTLVVVRRRMGVTGTWVSFGVGGLIISVCILSAYFFIMGWLPLLWPYFPRIMSTYDSNNALSFMFIVLLPALFVIVRHTSSARLARGLAALFLLLVVFNAAIVAPRATAADWTQLTAEFRHVVGQNVVLSSDYRVSLQSRWLTRWFPFYDPNGFQTGGRLTSLDVSPVYQSWYQTEVYYKSNIGTLSQVYVDDQPPREVSQYVGGPNNYAETRFWLDWYGTNTIVLIPAFYPLDNTVTGYLDRSAVFSTSLVSTSYGDLAIVKYNEPDPLLTATNASIVGFYSEQRNSLDEYNYLQALLSDLGLSSKYVVTIWIPSIEKISLGVVDLVITDEYTYSKRIATFNSITDRGISLLVTSSGQGVSPTTPSIAATGSLTQLPESLSQLSQRGLEGAYDLFQNTPLLSQISRLNSTSYSTSPPGNITTSPLGWTLGYSRNAVGTLQRGTDNFTVTLNIPDPRSSAQLNIDYALPGPVPLSQGVSTQLSAKTDTFATVGIVFINGNFTSNFLADNVAVLSGETANFQAPFSNFTEWNNPNSKFATAERFTLALNIPPGHSSATLQFRNISITTPGFSSYSLPAPVITSRDGFISNLPAPGPSPSLLLSDSIGNRYGSYNFQDRPSRVVPLADFTSEGNNSFTKILLVSGQPTQPLSITLLKRPPWTLDPNSWTTNQNLDIPKVPVGYRGLLWKETYTSKWDVGATDRNGHHSSLTYYSAGPGLVYIPLTDPSVVSLSITYIGYSIIELTIVVAAALTLVPVIIYRKRICRIGETRKIDHEDEYGLDRLEKLSREYPPTCLSRWKNQVQHNRPDSERGQPSPTTPYLVEVSNPARLRGHRGR